MTVQVMLEALSAKGISQKAIAEHCGTTQPTIHRAAKGAGVRYETGKAIEALYQQEVLGVVVPDPTHQHAQKKSAA
ncbi:helix-turn-helix domain-containing protein [Pseudomonas resinovorans]|uniref:Helix-turn-helix domain-containing protein n=1 Tax=Metapseudomonas resinovorans TaxID=53412 RepID=A0ABT4YAG6_METRE|nr:helix-turn-helix transcriptional regulator [Pseudomonas resinovorans]MDA8485869.1 helix-turn-helix domain-containing protein [Pseudomonas resinovorans]